MKFRSTTPLLLCTAIAGLPLSAAAQHFDHRIGGGGVIAPHLYEGGAAPGPTPEVVAIPVGPQDPVFGPGNDEPIPAPDHPPIEEIPPMPMPEGVDLPPLNPLLTGRIVEHDAQTGMTIEYPSRAPSGLQGEQGGGYIGALGIVDPSDELMDGFGTMNPAGGLGSWPRSGNVKLVMRFIDQNNSTRWFVCSGAMQDAGVILTAGHCVYARDPNNIDIFDWAEEIFIYPGWDGVGAVAGGPSNTAVLQNFGWTRGTTFYSWTNWTQSGDFNWDAGAIRINRGSHRNVGALTGWFGWAWGGSCSVNTSRTYHNFSYPAENCNEPGLHNGRDMLYWSGTFDSCPASNQLRIDTTAGCFTAVWGGMSGSNAYYIDDGSRFAHAVASTSNRSTRGTYVKFWESFIDHLNDNFRPAARGNTFDLEALRYRLSGSTSIPAGSTTSGSSFVAVNATNASRNARTYTVRAYLSTNNNITSSDTLLGTFTFNHAFDAMQNLTVNLPGLTIPSGTAPGDYWLGVILDPDTDSIPANNNTVTWDAQRITVTPALSGACCFPDGSCSILTSAQCSSQGGNYAGNNVTCAAADCPQPTGACCFAGGTCSTLTSSECASQGGAYAGNDVTCAAANCPTPDYGKELDLPPFNTTFSSPSRTRGMWFEAPTDFIITGLRVPNEENHPIQNVEVVRLNSAPPTWSQTTNDFTSLLRRTNVSSNNIIPANIPVAAGDIIGILGACGDSSMLHNSYGSAGPWETAILGRSATLHRLGMQFNLHSEPAQSLFTESSEVGRIEMFYTSPLGIDTLATDIPNNGLSSQGGVFFDISAQRDINITGLEYYANTSAGTPTKVEIWTRSGSYEEFTGDPSAWTLHDTVEAFSRGTAIPTPLPLAKALKVGGQQTRGIYLIGVEGGIRYNGTAAQPPQTTFSDDDITLYSEHARNQPWAGNLFVPRTFSGSVHYAITNAHEVAPDGYASTAGGSGRNTLMRDLERTVQFVVSASELSQIDPGTPITGITWRQANSGAAIWPASDVTWDRYDIELATSVNAPASFSTTFEDNIGADRVMVRSGGLTIPAGAFTYGNSPNDFGPVIPFTVPYIYQGGDLVVTVRHAGNGSSAAFMDSIPTSAPGYGQRFYYIDATNVNAATGAAATFPVTQFTVVAEGAVAGCYADCDGNEILNIDDFLCFINAFAQNDPYADCDDNDIFNIDDFLCFINEFAQGCP